MRKFIVFVLILSTYPLFSQISKGLDFKPIDSTKFIVSYSLTYKWDSLNLDNVRNQEMWLFLGKNTSYFVSKLTYLDLKALSKIKTRVELELWHDNHGPFISRPTYHIYKNYPKGKITVKQSSISGSFIYEEMLGDLNWELTQDTATIGGYLSQKATCKYGGREWTAWFTTEIPFNDGPYIFNGLPGFIVKIYDKRKHYVFELTGLEVADPNLMIDIIDKTYIETTRQKYLHTRKAMRNSIANIVKQRGGDSDSQQFVVQRMASRNNHIELK